MPYFTILAAVWSLYRVLWCTLSDKKRIFWIHSVSGLPASFLCIHFLAKNRVVCTNTLTSHRWDVQLYSSFLFWKVQKISNPTKKKFIKIGCLIEKIQGCKVGPFFSRHCAADGRVWLAESFSVCSDVSASQSQRLKSSPEPKSGGKNVFFHDIKRSFPSLESPFDLLFFLKSM